MNIKMTSFVSTFWWSLRTFGLYKVQCHKINPNVFCAMEAKNKGRLIQTGTNVPPTCSLIMLYNVVQVGMHTI